MAPLVCNWQLPVAEHVDRVRVGAEQALLSRCLMHVTFPSVECCVVDGANHRIRSAFQNRLEGHWILFVREELDGVFYGLALFR